MLHHEKKNDKSQPSTFVDGVHVKISEQYRPPRKIVLPISCQNCSPGEALYNEYNFRLEENILTKLAEWKRVRMEQAEKRKERLNTEAKVCEELKHFSNVTLGSTENEGVEPKQKQLNHHLTDSVLIPVCAKQNSPSHEPVSFNFNLSDFESDNSSPFDNMELKTINDMEVLASILSTNNVEQCVHYNNNNNNNSNNSNNNCNSNSINNNISDKDRGKNCLVLNNKFNEWGYPTLNGYNNISCSNLDYNHSAIPSEQKEFNHFGFYPISEHIQICNYGPNDFSNQFGGAVSMDGCSSDAKQQDSNILEKVKCDVSSSSIAESPKYVPGIMVELENELKENRSREEAIKKKNKLAYLMQSILCSGFKEIEDFPHSSREINNEKSLIEKLHDPTSELSPSSQTLVQYISEMGFPSSRVARACEIFKDDDKKVIEFLLQVQLLEGKNYPGYLVEKSLVINNFNLEESLRYLDAIVVLLDLGFDEAKVEQALLAANSDRDKALDILIA